MTNDPGQLQHIQLLGEAPYRLGPAVVKVDVPVLRGIAHAAPQYVSGRVIKLEDRPKSQRQRAGSRTRAAIGERPGRRHSSSSAGGHTARRGGCSAKSDPGFPQTALPSPPAACPRPQMRAPASPLPRWRCAAPYPLVSWASAHPASGFPGSTANRAWPPRARRAAGSFPWPQCLASPSPAGCPATLRSHPAPVQQDDAGRSAPVAVT